VEDYLAWHGIHRFRLKNLFEFNIIPACLIETHPFVTWVIQGKYASLC
jgi:hypothetical protein